MDGNVELFLTAGTAQQANGNSAPRNDNIEEEEGQEHHPPADVDSLISPDMHDDPNTIQRSAQPTSEDEEEEDEDLDAMLANLGA